jgi:hypothetical protein
MGNIKNIPKQYWIIAIAGGAIIGLILRSRRQTNTTAVAETQNPDGYQVAEAGAPSPALAQDGNPVFSGQPYPTYPDYPPYPDTAVTTDGSLSDVPTLLANLSDSQAVATASIVALENAVTGGKTIGKGGGAPKGKVVKSTGHPTHKDHPAHLGKHSTAADKKHPKKNAKSLAKKK